MPDTNYYVQPLTGVNLEIVTLDLNILDSHKICTWIACGKKKCEEDDENKEPGCSHGKCYQTLLARGQAAFRLLEARIAAAKSSVPKRQIIVNTHYPTTFLKWWKHGERSIADLLKDPDVHILYFGGHVHATDNKTNVDSTLRRHGWNDFCV